MSLLKKDPPGIYGDLPIDPHADLKRYTLEELKELRRIMGDREIAVDSGKSKEDEYETKNPDWEIFKKRLDDEINAR